MVLFLLLFIVLKQSSVQSYLAKRATKYVNDRYGTSILIDKVDVSNFKDLKLKNVIIKDHHDFDFITIKSLETTVLNSKKIIDNELELGPITINGLKFNLKTYQGEKDDNISIFAKSFDEKKTSTAKNPFLLTSSKIVLNNGNFYLFNENHSKDPVVFYNQINTTIKDFKLDGSTVFAKIRNANFTDDHKIKVKDFKTDFTYTKTHMLFNKLKLETNNSIVNTDFRFDYDIEDLGDFNNKVQISAKINKSEISLKDLKPFYKELGKTDKIYFTTDFKGTLNNFKLTDLDLVSKLNSKVKGNFHFKNSFAERDFSMQAKLEQLKSTYSNLKATLPNVLGKTLPSSFEMLGRFNIVGNTYVTNSLMDAQLKIESDLGTTISNLKLTNITDIDKATYQGNIELIDIDLGRIIKDPLVGLFSANLMVNGKGFVKETLETSVKGMVTKHQYKGYTYQNIALDGIFKEMHFNGKANVNDPNIKLDFKGLANFSSDKKTFKFKADVAKANFKKLNLFLRDDISVLKGKIDINLVGNTIDDIAGTIKFTDASYKNQNDLYTFKNFDISSSFKKDIRTLSVNSKDIINGKIKGKFKFNELPKLAKNSLGSIYTNFKKDLVSSNQFLDFNFKIHDKVVGVFFPKINVGKNTFVKGKINVDKNKFELTFKSPKLEIFDNVIDKIRLQIDNKNPLYNTLLSVDKVDSKYYNISKLNFVNVTLNDTLFIQTDFKGGKKLNDHYDLSLYHTINKNNQSVIGFKKSNVKVKNQKWILNKLNDVKNKVIFDWNFNQFNFKNFTAVADNQKIDFYGQIKGNNHKDLKLNLENIELAKIIPEIDSLKLAGKVNGGFAYYSDNKKTIPKVDATITNFQVNKLVQGDLSVQMLANKSFKELTIKTNLVKNKKQIINAKGKVFLNDKKNTIDANLYIHNLPLEPYSPLGGENITNIRGKVSGNLKINGLLENPNTKGSLYLENTGLSLPYLNVDYQIDDRQEVTVNNQTVDFNKTTIKDTNNQTEATLSGTIKHNKFKDWYLDLSVDSHNLLVLNTQEKEESLYFGTVFINGGITVKGNTKALNVEVNAKTNPKTKFVVPLSDINTIEENKLVRFITNNKKKIDTGRPEDIVFKSKGLTLLMDLEITPDALAEIVIDKATGSYLSGRGNAYLGVEINTNGKFEMYGTYVVQEGVYQLKNIVNKKFDVKRGGTIAWNGSPFDAFLDIEAVNKVKANPSVLLENIQSTRDIDVDLITKITGNLYEPNMNFDIKLPKASSLVQSELAFKINNDDKKMTQFFALLASGAFTNPDNADLANNSNSFLVGTLSERISSVLSNVLKSEGDIISLGVNLNLGDVNKLKNLRTDDQVGITFKTKVYKKVIINGEVGVPLNSNSQSGVTGEIEAELPLNKAENFRARMYNRRNEVEFDVLDSEGYTQGVGLSYEFNWDTGSEFLEKTGLKKTKEAKERKRLKKEQKKNEKDSIKQKLNN